MRPSPKYWWDFRDSSIVIESDYDEFPLLAKWYFFNNQEAEHLINYAEEVISDLIAGRADPRKMYKKFIKEGA